MKKINILFVCRYNRFRSRVALAYFNKVNRNKNIKARNAGLIKGNPLNEETVKITKNLLGLDISGKTKGLTSKDLVWQNLTVIVADNVPEQVFSKNKKYGKKVINWKIKDSEIYSKNNIIKMTNIIKNQVNKLIKELSRR